MTDQHEVTILVAEDDPDDRLLIDDALSESRLCNKIRFAHDGEELMQYLRNEGKFADEIENPRPGLILLDLNMPKMDGREALSEIKKDADLRRIPVVILTTSKAEEDVLKTYDLGVSSFITKPVSFEDFVDVMQTIGKYWFKIVHLPADD